MNRLRTIVVEDERLPRLTLLQKLATMADELEVIADCDNYDTALTTIIEKQPDLLLLDIQLQGRDSISLLRELQQQIPLPAIIFTTAYDDRNYLMSAIKLQAVDYLLKPVSPEELAAAIAKVRKYLESTGQEHLIFRTASGKQWVAQHDIAYIKAARNYSVLVCFEYEELVLDNLSILEKLLPSSCFLRVDRSTIVNRKTIRKIDRHHSTCHFISDNGKELILNLTKVALHNLIEKENL